MAIIYLNSLFSWKDIDDLGDLERLLMVLKALPDEELVAKLEQERKGKRNDYPVRAVWNSWIAGIIYGHPTTASLIRELLRNPSLRELCGFDPAKGSVAVPTHNVYSNFFKKLMRHQSLVDKIFHQLVETTGELIPNFAQDLAFDGKAIPAVGPRASKKAKSLKGKLCDDLRTDADANWGVKTALETQENGTVEIQKRPWFGYKLHLIVDANHELPIAYRLTKASQGEQPVMRELFDQLKYDHSNLIDRCEHAMGDRGYDGTELIKKLWDENQIMPIIDIRKMKKGSDETCQPDKLKVMNVVYDYKGTVYCHCPVSGEAQKMPFGGFEKDRNTLKYRCPAVHYGIECKGRKECKVKQSVRIPCLEDRRVFTPVARSSGKWQKLYNKRTSVERVNSRLDVSFGLEKHYIRGLKKMRVRCSITMSIMLALAVGRIRRGQPHHIRSLIKAA